MYFNPSNYTKNSSADGRYMHVYFSASTKDIFGRKRSCSVWYSFDKEHQTVFGTLYYNNGRNINQEMLNTSVSVFFSLWAKATPLSENGGESY